jgi:hypothetical protein
LNKSSRLTFADEYDHKSLWFKDQWYRLKHSLRSKEEKKLAGFVTVRVRRAERDPRDPSQPLRDAQGQIIYATDWKFITKLKDNLLTNGGRDFVHAQVLTNTSAGTRGAGFIAVSANAGGASAAHTTLAGEIASGGLTRADATTKTHSAGTNTSQFIHTFTASAGHTDVQLAGTFNASSSGTMLHENTFTATTLANGDGLEITWNFTYG